MFSRWNFFFLRFVFNIEEREWASGDGDGDGDGDGNLDEVITIVDKSAVGGSAGSIL
jgi:hypothetical protein